MGGYACALDGSGVPRARANRAEGPMNSKLSLTLAALLLSGCAARSTVSLVQAEQAVYIAREAGAPERAPYEWTLADEYMTKAREEWGHADYEAADGLAAKAQSWAEAAERAASDSARIEEVEGDGSDVPEDQPDVPTPETRTDTEPEPIVPVIESEQIDVPVWDPDEDDAEDGVWGEDDEEQQ